MKNVLKGARRCQHLAAATASWVREKETHPSNYCRCSHEKEELMRRKAQKAPAKNPPERVFSRLTSPTISFVAAVHRNQQQKSSQQH
jgi:hypothetical protein